MRHLCQVNNNNNNSPTKLPKLSCASEVVRTHFISLIVFLVVDCSEANSDCATTRCSRCCLHFRLRRRGSAPDVHVRPLWPPVPLTC